MDKKLFQLGRMISFLGFADAGLTWLLAYNGYCTMVDMQMGESLPQLIRALRDEGDLYPCIFTLLIVLLAVAAFVLLFRKKSRVSRMSLVYGVVCGLFVVTLTAGALITVFAVLSVLDGAADVFPEGMEIYTDLCAFCGIRHRGFGYAQGDAKAAVGS